jgi:hypothetical protein
MFFIIWGFKRYVSQLAMLTLVCGNCQRPSAHPLRRVVTKFTLFWIPLFRTSTKYTLQCTFCGAGQYVTQEEADRLLTAPPHVPPMPERHDPVPPQYQDRAAE